ncbi:D-Ala-D-Ala carboxypeptidase [Saccharospirillum salsuginis]|uniref:serine-type D-Ala-D-Ala carboxypeptidase n=2 Tax=Saccharospirillum salsuginis TaxID=418750 RepID=A0A918KNH0_9GAMM|nr:D-alanyl-D-alanine carboxypeptidase family protein [Saccharospirillum salsuginis]GGX69604.1 D-Ala-D-Ala carboxypeptidase [Saccharospirillum salsuginis]
MLNHRFRVSCSRLFAVCITVVASLSMPLAAEPIIPAAPQLAASSYILMDAETGQVLVSENADERLPPASLTKLMTSYIAEREILEGRIGLQDETLISVKAWKTGGSRMFIQEGKMVSIEDLLRGIIVQSGNDASVAMAEHIAGSEDMFAQMMNTYAERLNMENTQYANATGLPADNHYTSAEDLAILARHIIQDNAEFYPIYAERSFTYNGITQANRNSLLGRNPAVDGLKTGHTEEAGYCLAASAEQDGMRLISVVMGTSSEEARAQETQKLLTYGFRYFQTAKVHSGDEALYTARVWAGNSEQVRLGLEEDLKLTIARGAEGDLSTVLNIEPVLKAPIEKGQVLGELLVRQGDEEVTRRPLLALEPIEQAGFFKRIWDYILLFFFNLFNGN